MYRFLPMYVQTNALRYVLSTTHLHEFKSADKGQAPVMSLYLPEQKLGSHSTGDGSSNKFILKGRQTGAMHRGHTWVFRAESHDTMMAWYEDIKALTERTPEERNQFVRHHSRSLSQSSRRSASSDGGLVDEDDEEPFSAGAQIDVNPRPQYDAASRRSQPGGRFPSDIQVNAQRGLQAPRSQSSLSSGSRNRRASDAQAAAAASALPGSGVGAATYGQGGYHDLEQTPVDESSHAAMAQHEALHDGVNPYTSEPVQRQEQQQQMQQQPPQQQQQVHEQQVHRHHHQDHTYVAPVITSYPNNTEARNEPVAQPTERAISSEPEVAEGHQNGTADFVVAGSMAPAPVNEPKIQPSGPFVNISDKPADAPVPVRPTGNTTRNDSVNTISNLHVPGGYPRGSVA